MAIMYDNRHATPSYNNHLFPSVVTPTGNRDSYIQDEQIIGGYVELATNYVGIDDDEHNYTYESAKSRYQIIPSTYGIANPNISKMCILAVEGSIRISSDSFVTKGYPILSTNNFSYVLCCKSGLIGENAPKISGKFNRIINKYSSPIAKPPWILPGQEDLLIDISSSSGTIDSQTIEFPSNNTFDGYNIANFNWTSGGVDNVKINFFLNKMIEYNNSLSLPIPGSNALWSYALGGYSGSSYTTIKTNLPIFTMDSTEAFWNWWNDGTYDDANNIIDIKYGLVDFSTDWKLYIKGKSPTIKLLWDSPALLDFIASSDNKDSLTLDQFKIEISAYDTDGYLKTITNVPYVDKCYTTTYGKLAELKDISAWTNFISATIGSILGIGDLQLFFRVYNDNTSSALCYCAIPFNKTPTLYGISALTEIEDNSTVTIFYGASGETDDGYIDPTEPTPTDEIITNGGTIPTTNGGFTGVGLLSTTYSLTRTQVEQLGSFIWGDNFYTNIKLLNNSPIENIVSIKALPVVVSGTKANIILGNVDTGVSGSVVSNYHDTIINIGSIAIVGMYGSFLDYSPFTKLTIFLPFIGFKELDTSLFMGKVLSVKYIFDLLTGCVKACLSANDIYVMSFDGSAGIDIPITASNRASVEAGYITTLGTSLLSASANPIGAVASTLSMATVQNHYQTQGSYSPACGAYETRNCYIIYDRPVVQYPTTYAHNFGKPCALSQTIGNLNGYTEVSKGVDLSNIPCTASEKEMIRAILMYGFFA